VRLRDVSRDELPVTLTAVETAELLGVHVETLRKLVRQGCAPVPALHVGRALRFPTARVLEALGVTGAERQLADASVADESSPSTALDQGRRPDGARQ
jgi:excisionase family DNA binding protein